MVLVVFLGGVTFAEIAAIRLLSSQEGACGTTRPVDAAVHAADRACASAAARRGAGQSEYIVATTNILNGRTMIESLIDDLTEARMRQASGAPPAEVLPDAARDAARSRPPNAATARK